MNSYVAVLLLVALAMQFVLLAIGYRLNKWIFTGTDSNQDNDDQVGHPFYNNNKHTRDMDPRQLATIHVLCDWVLLVTMGLAFCWNFSMWSAAFCLALALHVMLECKTQRNGVLYHTHSTGLVAGLWHKAWCASVFALIALVAYVYESDHVDASGKNTSTITAEWSMNQKLALMGACITVILGVAAMVVQYTQQRWQQRQEEEAAVAVGSVGAVADDKGEALV